MTNFATVETPQSPHLTVPQLAERWHTSAQAIYSMRHRGKAPKGFKRGVTLLFPLDEVKQFEADRMAADRPSNRDTDPSHRPAEASLPRRNTRQSSAASATVPAQRSNPAA